VRADRFRAVQRCRGVRWRGELVNQSMIHAPNAIAILTNFGHTPLGFVTMLKLAITSSFMKPVVADQRHLYDKKKRFGGATIFHWEFTKVRNIR